jgi:hypothetical protein
MTQLARPDEHATDGQGEIRLHDPAEIRDQVRGRDDENRVSRRIGVEAGLCSASSR